jgi:hypothetical protein
MMYIPNNNQAGISDFNLFFIFAQDHMPTTLLCQARSGLLPRSRAGSQLDSHRIGPLRFARAMWTRQLTSSQGVQCRLIGSPSPQILVWPGERHLGGRHVHSRCFHAVEAEHS